MLSAMIVVSFAVLWYVFKGYLLVLRAFLLMRGRSGTAFRSAQEHDAWSVTVIVTVHNEERSIVHRIANLVSQDYPAHLLEVLIASDGSTDGTDALVSNLKHPQVRLLRPVTRLGKSGTQNVAVREARGDIIIFTDADTEFDRLFVRRIADAFQDPRVGAADGHLAFEAQDGNQVAQSQGYYWAYELQLREAESRLGILAVTSGACVAVRKRLFRDMDASVGEDCILPLDVVAQGYRVVHVRDALAYDCMENAPDREFRARVRMTLRNWQGTWSRPDLLNPFRHPGVAFSLWSHKVLRWLSPFMVLTLAISANAAAVRTLPLGLAFAPLIDGVLLLSLVGWWANIMGARVPVAGAAFSFMLANAGFLVGVFKAIRGHTIREYKKA